MYRFLLLTVLIFLCLSVNAQAPYRDTADNVKVVFAEWAEYLQQQGRVIQWLRGSVELQQNTTTMYCDSCYKEDNNVIAYGRVVITQGDSLHIFGDSVRYQGNIGDAELLGDVVLENNQQKLFTKKLDYNTQTKVAVFNTRSLLTDGKTQLSSDVGYYYVNEELAYFKQNVTIIDTSFNLRTDTLKFDTKNKIAHFVAPTLIQQNGSKIYCEKGYYDTQNKLAVFTDNAQYQKEKQKAVADTMFYDGSIKEVRLIGNAHFEDGAKKASADVIRYDEENDITYLEGNPVYEDDKQRITSETRIVYDRRNESFKTEGRSRIVDGKQIIEADEMNYGGDNGFAYGNVVMQDTVNNTTIVTENAIYNKKTDFIKAYGIDSTDNIRMRRPMLISVVDKDSLYLTADTLVSFRPQKMNSDSMLQDSIVLDTVRQLLAYRDVRIFKSDLQGLCDSLTYSSSDSIFRLYKNPIMWADTSQFTADTMHILTVNNKIDKVLLINKALIVNTKEEIYYNQVRGKNITALFNTDSQLYKMLVNGNAESIYYGTDEAGAYVGVNKAICGEMTVLFGNNQVEGIRFYTQHDGNIIPMRQANHNTLRLEDFRWEFARRPMALDDLFK